MAADLFYNIDPPREVDMEKRLKYFNEVQIMHNGMEHISSTNGTVSVEPKKAVVGQPITLKITYTVGEDVIYDGGVLRFTIPFGFTPPQIQMPIYPAYCTAASNRKEIRLETFKVVNDWWKRGPDRKKTENVCEHVGTHVWVRVLGADLQSGDTVTLTYGDTSYTAQAAGRTCPTCGPVQFDVGTDAKGDLAAPYSGYYRIKDPDIMWIDPTPAAKFEVFGPSDMAVGQPAEFTVVTIDQFHNPALSYTGPVVVTAKLDGDSSEQVIFEGSFTESDCGIMKLNYLPDQEGVVRFTARAQGLASKTGNPAIIHSTMPTSRRYWGDMHGHTGISWGRGSGRSYYEYANQIAAVDFCALTDPDAGRYTNNNATAKDSISAYLSDAQWEEIRRINKEFYQPGSFVPILGYEYHNDAPNPEFGGDRNVYYADYDQPIRRCIDEGSYCPEELWQQFKEQKVQALTVPHHTAKKVMLGSYELHNEEYQRLVEIYSSWGNSECEGCERPIIGGAVYEEHSVQYGLSKGYRLGFVTGSDSHAGTPGYCHWVFSSEMEGYRGGLTCIRANQLDQDSVFDALYNRRTYATTGERILLDVDLNGISMGQEGSLADNVSRQIQVDVIGTAAIDTVEIISMGRTVYTYQGEGPQARFVFTDTSEVADGWIYYYVRVKQKDKAMAWSSPIWLS